MRDRFKSHYCSTEGGEAKMSIWGEFVLMPCQITKGNIDKYNFVTVSVRLTSSMRLHVSGLFGNITMTAWA